MAWFFGQSLLFVVLAFLLGVLVGYLIWGRLLFGRRAGSTVEPGTETLSRPTAPAESRTEALSGAALTESPTQALPESVPVLAGVPAAAAEPSSRMDGDLAAAPEPASDPDGDLAGALDAEAESVAEAEPAVAEPAEAEPAEAVDGVDLAAEAVAVPAESDTQVLPGAALSESATQVLPVPVDDATSGDAPDDDLRRIEGIGPAFERALRAAGIRTYTDLAGADRATLLQALAQARLSFAPSLPTWSRQARLLADGDEAGFAELTRRLIAGREIIAPLDSAMDPGALTADPASDLVAAHEPDAEPAADAEPVADTEPVTYAEPMADAEPVADADPTVVIEPVAAAPSPEPVTDADATVVIEPVAGTASEQDEAVPVPDDDLQRIEGIGPKMSLALHTAGIRTYRQLAASDTTTIRAAIEVAGLRFAPSLVTWARQAALLAEGDEAGLADLQRRLVAGRDVGRV